MTPNEKGAFCLACQKTVVDFSKKTTKEIKSFFKTIPSTQKICGRFKEEQLTELTFDDFFERFKKWLLPKKVAVVLILVFGFSLFSCQTTKHEPLIGKVAYVPDEFTSSDKVTPTEMVLGEIELPVTNTVTPQQSQKVKQIRTEEMYLKGDVDFDPDTTTKIKCTPKATLPEKMIKGKVKVAH